MAAQAGLCLAWSETPKDMFSHDEAHMDLIDGLPDASVEEMPEALIPEAGLVFVSSRYYKKSYHFKGNISTSP